MNMSLLASGLFPGEEDCHPLQSATVQPIDCLHHPESAPHPHINSKCWDNSYEMILTPLDRCAVSSGVQWSVGGNGGGTVGGGVVPVRRRNCANRKERKRTQSINNAFADLRDRIPNVPADTKLSKIKTLRLATSYIGYLLTMLERGDTTTSPGGGFAAELPPPASRAASRLRNSSNEVALAAAAYSTPPQTQQVLPPPPTSTAQLHSPGSAGSAAVAAAAAAAARANKGRTGWPQHVWALELGGGNGGGGGCAPPPPDLDSSLY